MVADPPADPTPALTASATKQEQVVVSALDAGLDVINSVLTLSDVSVHGVDDDSDSGCHVARG